MAEYTNHYVAFLDILGFKDLISESCNVPSAICVDEIRKILDLPEPAQEDQIILGRIGDIANSGHRATAFSDSIIITTDETDQGLIHILHHVSKIGFYLAKLGVLYRGGITRGQVFHDEKHAFGPAIVEAYDIEQNAIFPRVLLSKTVIDAGRNAVEPVNTIFDRFIHTDSDSHVFVNYLRVLRMAADSGFSLSDDLMNLQNDIRNRIATQLRHFPVDTKEWCKWDWFANYFAWATDNSLSHALNVPFPAQ